MKERNFFKKIITAGLIFVGNEIHAQNFEHWHVVTDKEWARYKLPSSVVDSVNLRGEFDSGKKTAIDNSKVGRKVIDRSGATFYWVNEKLLADELEKIRQTEGNKQKNYDENKKEVVLEEPKKIDSPIDTLQEKEVDDIEIEKIINDPEIQSIMENFKVSFHISNEYSILGRDIKTKERYYPKGTHVFTPEKFKTHGNKTTLLIDKKLNKEVLIFLDQKEDLFRFLQDISGPYLKLGLKIAILNASRKGILPHSPTFEEKKSFLKKYFTEIIPNTVQDLPKYKAPVIFDDDFMNEYEKEVNDLKSYILRNKTEDIDLTPADINKNIDIDDKKLDEFLKEEEKKGEPK